MRTTLTLDDDIAAELRRRTRMTGQSLRQVVNQALRQGLMPSGTHTPASVLVHDIGWKPGVDIRLARHLAAELEDEEHQRKLELRK